MKILILAALLFLASISCLAQTPPERYIITEPDRIQWTGNGTFHTGCRPSDSSSCTGGKCTIIYDRPAHHVTIIRGDGATVAHDCVDVVMIAEEEILIVEQSE